MKTIDVDLYRVTAGDQSDPKRLVGQLEVGQETSMAWIDLMKKSNDLGQSAHSGGLICIKLYANLMVRDSSTENRALVPVELEFHGDSVKVRVPKFGSTVRRLRPFESDYSAGAVLSRPKLAGGMKRIFLPQPAVAGGIVY